MAVYVEGKIRTRKWQDRDGQDRYSTEIEGVELTMLGARGGAAPDVTQVMPNTTASEKKTSTNDVPWLDDIPF